MFGYVFAFEDANRKPCALHAIGELNRGESAYGISSARLLLRSLSEHEREAGLKIRDEFPAKKPKTKKRKNEKLQNKNL